MAEQVAELALQPGELKESDGSIEFHEEIDVALVPSFIAGE